MSRYTLAKYQKNQPIDACETEFSPDDAFDILEELLGVENVGYIAIIDATIKLKQENSMLRDLLQNRMPVGCIAETTYQPVLEENEKLKEKIDDIKEENKKLEEKSKELRESVDRNQAEIHTLRSALDKHIETDSEEEECIYDNDDEWRFGYGFTSKDGECRITMAGGGDHWYDYVIKKNGCFIHSKEGMEKVRTFILSDPEIRKDYLRVIETCETYTPAEGEQDMRDVVKQHYPEVLEYEDDSSGDEGFDTVDEDEEK